MSISQIQPDGGINPLKDQNVNQAEKQGTASGQGKKEVAAGGDSVEISAQAKLYQEVGKLKPEVEDAPSPSEGRIAELKESIANGTYITTDKLQETADLLASQILS